MEIRFSIWITLKTPAGEKSFGSFELGQDKQLSTEIFGLLSGNAEQGESRYICLQLREEIAGLPVTIGLIHCRLNELKENTAIITREIFKAHHLEQ